MAKEIRNTHHLLPLTVSWKHTSHALLRSKIFVSGMRCDDSAAVSDANESTVTARACSYFRDLQRPQSASRLSCFWAFLGIYSHYLGIYVPYIDVCTGW